MTKTGDGTISAVEIGGHVRRAVGHMVGLNFWY